MQWGLVYIKREREREIVSHMNVFSNVHRAVVTEKTVCCYRSAVSNLYDWFLSTNEINGQWLDCITICPALIRTTRLIIQMNVV